MTMKKTMLVAIGVAMMAAVAVGAGGALRADVRGAGWIATGVEQLGDADGGSVTAWDTTKLADGWTTVESGGTQARVLVLNGPVVEGGRLAGNVSWGAERVHVVRHDMVVGAGKTLTLGAGAVVKLADGTKLVVEKGGRIVAKGALLADLADDSVGGDVNLDGGASEASGEWTDWVPAGAGLVEVKFLDGAAKAAPSKTYTVGHPLGDLPVLERAGARFEGWRTAPDGGGAAVGSDTAVGEGMAVLHSWWTVLSLEVSPVATNVAAVAGTCKAGVRANVGWMAETDAPWLSVNPSSGDGDAEVTVTATANRSETERTGTVRFSLKGSGNPRDFTVIQAAMERVSTPVVSPGDGTTFQANAQRVVVRCGTEGATVRYTLDGSEPREGSPVAPGSGFNVFDTTVVKVRAWADGMLPSEVATVRLVRLQTLAEALDVPLWKVETDAEYGWFVDIDTSDAGGSSARSGSIGPQGRSAMTTSVSGSGMLSFRWKASCEDDPDDTWRWDCLSFEVDGVETAHLDGHTDWVEVQTTLGGGMHSLKWTYEKDGVDGDEIGEDCGWVDAVSWTPTVSLEGGGGIPVEWFENQGLVALGGTAEDAAVADPDGDGMTTAQEYVAGTDPNDPGSVLEVELEWTENAPDLRWAPRLDGRRYRVLAKKKMTDTTWEDVTNVADWKGEGWRFFAVAVEGGE